MIIMYNSGVEQPEDINIVCNDIIDSNILSINGDGWQKWWQDKKEFQLKKAYSKIINNKQKAICMTARQMSSWNGNLVQAPNGLRFITPIECCRLQTLPDDYCDSVSLTQAYKAIGNGWTVDVIAHIFKGMRQ